MRNVIRVRGAREHNLKNIDVDIPKDKLVVFTGVSGSGKSSLAFDTIYAEGQRRYVESLSSYARQFLGVMSKPDVDTIDGLSPAIAIDQKTVSHNPRSTVGTVTEIYDYLRLLFARIGHPHCPVCGREIERQSVDQIVEKIIDMLCQDLEKNPVVRYLILAPVVRDRKGEFTGLFNNLRSQGFTQARIDGRIFSLEDDLVLLKTNRHTIEVVIDRIAFAKNQLGSRISIENLRSRIAQDVEQALDLSAGLVVLSKIEDAGLDFPQNSQKFRDFLYSEEFACPVDNINLSEIEPRTFSFNSPHGACPACSGIGTILRINPEKILNPKLTIEEGGILPMGTLFEKDTWYARLVRTVAEEHGFDTNTPIEKLPKDKLNILLYGTGKEYRVFGTNRLGQPTSIIEKFDGIIAELERRYSETESEYLRAELERYMIEETCPQCKGARLKPEALAVTVAQHSIIDITKKPINEALQFIQSLRRTNLLTDREKRIGELILKEIETRLEFLVSVGLDYLTLDRPAKTLAGGESQRIRLASQIGSGLTGVLYVLDEPTIGLHQRDNQKLIKTLKKLRDLGNTVLVVEHDREMIESADWILDFGPKAGKDGGAIVAQGPLEKILQTSTLTAEYLKGTKSLWFKKQQLKENKGKLVLRGAREHNLKNIDVEIPLGKFVCITGVSGSGKSTLLVDTLYPALKNLLGQFWPGHIGQFDSIDGFENLSRVFLIDQSPIGRTPRSNPVTYTGIFSYIRDLFAQTPEARVKGYKPGRFSFNIKGGRCEACEGQGVNKIEMQFLSDIYITCDVCKGQRYNKETLEVEWHGKNIAEVLLMTVDEALEFFAKIPAVASRLKVLVDVGLGYIELGQPATTLSGGEAQRVKLAAELMKGGQDSTLYILDEPTTGLHFADIYCLLSSLRKLVDKGNTVLVIEHNLDVIKNADWIIDLGPEGGDAGGKVVAVGTPEDIIKTPASYTGRALRKVFKK